MESELTPKLFLVRCEKFLESISKQEHYMADFLSGLSQSKMTVEVSPTSFRPMLPIKINVTKEKKLDKNETNTLYQKYDEQMERDKYWHQLNGQQQQKRLEIQLWNLVESKDNQKSFQYDVFHSFHIAEKYYPFIIQSENYTERDRCSILIFLIFILKEFPKVRKYEESICQQQKSSTLWRTYMTRKLTRYYYNLLAIYQKRFMDILNDREYQKEADFIFGQISYGIFDQDYTKALTILFNIYYYKYRTSQRSNEYTMEKDIHSKSSFFLIIKENQTQNQSSLTQEYRKQSYRHRERDSLNQMEYYRFLQQQISPQPTEKDPQWFRLLQLDQDPKQRLNSKITQKPLSQMFSKSFSKSTFMLHISPAFQKFFEEQKILQDPKNQSFNQQFSLIQEHIKTQWDSFPNHCSFYCRQYNTICLLQFRDQQQLIFLKNEVYHNKIKSINVRIQKANIQLKQKPKGKDHNVLKLIYLKLRYHQNIKFQTGVKVKKLTQAKFLKYVFQHIMHAVREVKNERLLTDNLQIQKIIQLTKIPAYLQIDNKQSLQKTLIIQYFCNIFVRTLEQFEVRSQVPALYILLIQSLRLTYSYINKNKQYTQETDKIICEQELNKKIQHYLEFGIQRASFQKIKQNQLAKDHQHVYKNQFFFQSDFVNNPLFKRYGVFWCYIQVILKIFDKIHDKNEETVIINSTIKSIVRRKLRECSLLYSFNSNHNAIKVLKLQAYFITLTYSNSIRVSLRAKEQRKEITRSKIHQLAQSFRTIARLALNDFQEIQKNLQLTMFSDSKADFQRLKQELLDLYKFNIPYTSDTYEACYQRLYQFDGFKCQPECMVCKQFNIFFFPGKDCFIRFKQCTEALNKHVSGLYTQGYKMLMQNFLGIQLCPSENKLQQ